MDSDEAERLLISKAEARELDELKRFAPAKAEADEELRLFLKIQAEDKPVEPLEVNANLPIEQVIKMIQEMRDFQNAESKSSRKTSYVTLIIAVLTLIATVVIGVLTISTSISQTQQSMSTSEKNTSVSSSSSDRSPFPQ